MNARLQTVAVDVAQSYAELEEIKGTWPGGSKDELAFRTAQHHLKSAHALLSGLLTNWGTTEPQAGRRHEIQPQAAHT